MTRIKRSHLAGTWYAAGAATLRAQVDELLANAPVAAPPSDPPIAALVVPHAGYAYSGRAAGIAYARLRGGAYRRVVILAPSHYAAFRGVALLDVDAFETPLGAIQVDPAGVAVLAEAALCREDPEPYREEHALEIQLPFLQRVLPDVLVVPVLLGRLRDDDYATLAGVLGQLEDAGTLFIVSSDFVHYGARFDYLPFPPHSAERVRDGLRGLDMGALELVCAGDAAGFRAYVAATGATICGRVPIAAFLALHDRRTPGRLLAYYTSLDVTQDYEHVVSYASIAFPQLMKG